MSNIFGQHKFGEKQWGYEATAPTFVSNLLELEISKFRKPYLKCYMAWGGNWTRQRNIAGTLLSSITSSGEDGSGNYPDDRAIDGIRPHKDPLASTWNGWWQSAVKPSVTPQWLKIDFSKARSVNRIVLYHYYDADHVAKDFQIQSSSNGTDWLTRKYVTNNQDTKTIVEFSTAISARYWRLYITACSTDVVAKVQEIEFYNFVDESEYLDSPGGETSYNINMKIANDVNSLPEPVSFNLTLLNTDSRFSPYNEDSEIYGDKQIDGFGYIRSGTPVIIKGGFYDANDNLGLVEIVIGQIGSEDNPAASSGIELLTDESKVLISGKDFSNKMKQSPIPDSLPVYENYNLENLIRELGYIANIPYQDMQLEASGITIPYAIFAQTTVYEEMEKLRESISGKLFTSFNETLKFITTIPFRSWLQSEETDFQTGEYSTDDVDISTESGKIIQKGQDSAADWAAGTATNVDLATESGSILLPKTGTAAEKVFYHDHVLQGATGGGPYNWTMYSMPCDFTSTNGFKATSLTVQFYLLLGGITNTNVHIRLRHGATVLYDWTYHALTSQVPPYVYTQTIDVNIAKDDNTYYVDYIMDESTSACFLTLSSSFPQTFTGWHYTTGGTLVTQTIDYGMVPYTYGDILVSTYIPTGASIKVYVETKTSDAGWGSPTLVKTLTATGDNTITQAELTAAGITIREFLQLKFELIQSGYAYDTPKVYAVYYSGEIILQEHDFTAAITDWGIASYNDEGTGTVILRLHTYSSSGTSYDDASAVTLTAGAKISATVLRYGKLKISFSSTSSSNLKKILDVTLNWLVQSGQTRNYIFKCDFSGEEEARIKNMTYVMGNPKCNYALVDINPFISQAIATIWTFNDTPTIANGATLTIPAFYTNPTIKSSGGNLRTLSITISGSADTCADGATETINGCDVSFISGANVGTIVVTNNSGSNRQITVCTIAAIELLSATQSKRQVRAISQNATSIAVYGNKKFMTQINNNFIPTLVTGQSLADTEVVNGKYSKGYVTNLIIPFAPNITLQDIISITHDKIKATNKQTLPVSIQHSKMETQLQCAES